MKKFVVAAGALGVCSLALVSCGPKENSDGLKASKIGFIIAGNIGDEMRGFQAAWKEVAEQYNATLIYEQFQGQDPSYYKTCAENLISQEVDAIICNFEMAGKENVAELCIKEKVYFGYSGSTLTDEQFEKYASNPYFVGQVSPSAAVEENEAYKMTKYYIEKYYVNESTPLPAGTNGTFGVWPVDFHGITLEHQMTYRYKGMKKALAEYGVTINGDDQFDSSKWTATYGENTPARLKDNVVFLGNNMAAMDALINQCSGIFAKKPSVVVTTCMGDFLMDMFASQGSQFGVLANNCEFGTIDGFTKAYDKWYVADAANPVNAYKFAHTPYLVGKYNAINVPMLALTIKAVNGQAVRDNGKAVSIDQTYLVATNKEEFEAAKEKSTSFKFTKEQLDNIKSVKDVENLFASVTLK